MNRVKSAGLAQVTYEGTNVAEMRVGGAALSKVQSYFLYTFLYSYIG
jgi:hypothetical protein